MLLQCLASYYNYYEIRYPLPSTCTCGLAHYFWEVSIHIQVSIQVSVHSVWAPVVQPIIMQDAHTVDHKPLKWAVAYFMQSDSMGCGLCGVLGQCQPVTVKRNCVVVRRKKCTSRLKDVTITTSRLMHGPV